MLQPILERGLGPEGRRGLPSRDVARARRPGPRGLDDEDDPEGRRRHLARLHDRRRRRLPRRDRHGARGLDARSSGADEAAREHLPRRQHRARQRAGAAVRPDGDRRLGGRRRCRDEAVRIRVVQAWPRPRRPLHPDRPLLPHLEGARVRLLDTLHRARRRGQQQHAVLLPLAHLAGAEPRREEVGEWRQDPDHRRRVQARHRRHARDAGREAHPPAEDGRRGRRVPRSVRPRVRRDALGAARAGGLRLRRDRDQPFRHRLRRRRRARKRDRRFPQRDQGPRGRRQGLEALTSVGVVGLNYWGPNLVRNFDGLAELTWVCDLDPAHLATDSRRATRTRGRPRATTTCSPTTRSTRS